MNYSPAVNLLKPIVLAICLLLVTTTLLAESLTESETRGKQFYTMGKRISGKAVTALIGAENTELSSTQVPCISCHGEDGLGQSEGGIVPTNITFEYLTLSYGHQHENGRKHPAFTSDSIIKAITQGIDPANNPLDNAMPRYKLSDTDSRDLIAYLQRLSSDTDAGLTNDSIRIGTLLPTQGALADLGLAMKNLLTAYINELNAKGGIYNRKLILEVAEFTGDKESTLKNVHHLLESKSVFALLVPFAGNFEQEILTLSEQHGIPQIAPYTLFPEEDIAHSRFTFYLLPGLNNEARAMVDYATKTLHLTKAQAIIISPTNSEIAKVADTIKKYSQTYQLGKVHTFNYSNDFSSNTLKLQLADHKPDIIYFFGSANELQTLLKSTNKLKTKPVVFISGSLTGTQVVNEHFRDKLFLALPAYQNSQTANEFFQLLKRNKLSTQHLTAQAVGYGAVKLFIEGLQQTGKTLSRKKLLDHLEKIYDFDAGLLPPVSYSNAQHIGSNHIRIIPATANK